ncbi:MAG TPA: endo-1,4-beta-xylanase [Candidatus Nitrosopolaris sp.]|nr:endo-1,4-beta-xylanase [Candidatus Nitrosopolaris sp.]
MQYWPKIKKFFPQIHSLVRRHPLLAGLVLAVLLVAVLFWVARQAAAPSRTEPAGPAVNLVTGQDWSHFTGANQDDKGVHITGLGRAIVNQDGTPNQTNPPVNVRGPHLILKGDFSVQASIQQIPKASAASLYLYGAVPIIYDEWRYQTPQLCLKLSQKNLALSLWNGSGDQPVDQKSWNNPIGPTANIQVNVIKGNLEIWLNSRYIDSIPGHGIFSGGQLWFGADESLDSPAWLLRSLSAAPLAGGQVQVIASPQLKIATSDPASLRSLARSNPRQIPIGAAIANYALFSDPAYRQLVATQFSMLTPENELKAQFTEPQPNVYTFTDADNLVDFALANGMTVHGHNLVFSEANPQWMQSAPLDQRQQIMVDHITTEVKHFGSKINEWDVVDEPLNDNDDDNGNSSDLRHNIWFAAMGENYINIAFQTAHAANPGAKLYINEYGLEADGLRWDEFLALIKRLQSQGTPIDGVGFQAHVYEPGDEVDQATLTEHMKILADMGLLVRVSEMDVYGDSPSHQAQQYAGVLQACLDSPNCTSFNTWGVTDRYGSTTQYHAYPLELGNDLIWDAGLKPKPAYRDLQNILNER